MISGVALTVIPMMKKYLHRIFTYIGKAMVINGLSRFLRIDSTI